MRLDFNVLWLDDQPKGLESYRDQFARVTEAQGFALNVTWATSLKDLKEVFSPDQGVFADQLDLVMVDYDLGTRLQGDEALREIRDKLPFKEVIFYSAKPTSELRRLAFEQNVEGVHCANRQDLVDSATWVFELLVKKVLDVDHARGVVLGATSDIDHLVHEILLHVYRTASPEDAQVLREDVIGRIEEKIADLNSDAANVREEVMDVLLERYNLVTSETRIRILIAHLKKNANPKLKTFRTKLSKYLSNILPERNLLAHVRMVLTATGRVLQSRDGRKSLDNKGLRELRRRLLEHRQDFHELRKLLAPDEKKDD